MEVQNLPFNRTLGLNADGDRVYLSPVDQHLNHVGTVHATVIFGVAEAASGNLLVRQFPELLDTYGALLRESTTKFRRPATPDSEISATATYDDETNSFLETLESRGRATIDITVSVTQNGAELFVGVFKWFAARK